MTHKDYQLIADSIKEFLDSAPDNCIDNEVFTGQVIFARAILLAIARANSNCNLDKLIKAALGKRA